MRPLSLARLMIMNGCNRWGDTSSSPIRPSLKPSYPRAAAIDYLQLSFIILIAFYSITLEYFTIFTDRKFEVVFNKLKKLLLFFFFGGGGVIRKGIGGDKILLFVGGGGEIRMGKQESKDVQQNGYDLQKHRNLHISIVKIIFVIGDSTIQDKNTHNKCYF